MVLRALLAHALLFGLDTLRENYTSDHTGSLGTTLLFSSNISDFPKLEHSPIGNVPINTPRALLPEYLVDLILKRSSKIVDIRNLSLLRS